MISQFLLGNEVPLLNNLDFFFNYMDTIFISYSNISMFRKNFAVVVNMIDLVEDTFCLKNLRMR